MSVSGHNIWTLCEPNSCKQNLKICIPKIKKNNQRWILLGRCHTIVPKLQILIEDATSELFLQTMNTTIYTENYYARCQKACSDNVRRQIVIIIIMCNVCCN